MEKYKYTKKEKVLKMLNCGSVGGGWRWGFKEQLCLMTQEKRPQAKTRRSNELSV